MVLFPGNFPEERSIIIDIPINTVQKKILFCTVATHVHGSPLVPIFVPRSPFSLFQAKEGETRSPYSLNVSQLPRATVRMTFWGISSLWGLISVFGSPFSQSQSNRPTVLDVVIFFLHLILIDCRKLHQWSS